MICQHVRADRTLSSLSTPISFIFPISKRAFQQRINVYTLLLILLLPLSKPFFSSIMAVNGGQEVSSSSASQQLPLLSLNHVSFVCSNVSRSVKFYNDVLGFVLIRRPSSFDFEGAWLFNHGIGIHLLEVESTPTKTGVINPKDNHISFQCTNMDLIIKKLEEMGIKYVTAVVKEGGVEVNQLFFHDPDGYMIEICNCHVLPVLPITSCPLKKLKSVPKINQVQSSMDDNVRSKSYYCGEDEVLMMDNLLVDMMGISF